MTGALSKGLYRRQSKAQILESGTPNAYASPRCWRATSDGGAGRYTGELGGDVSRYVDALTRVRASSAHTGRSLRRLFCRRPWRG